MALRLDQSLQYFKGIGPQRYQELSRVELYTVEDLLFNFPRDYEDRREITRIGALCEGAVQTVLAEVLEIEPGTHGRRGGGRQEYFDVVLSDGTGTAIGRTYNRWLVEKLEIRDLVVAAGELKRDRKRDLLLFWPLKHCQILRKHYERTEGDSPPTVGEEAFEVGRLVPVYRATGERPHFFQRLLRRLSFQVVPPAAREVRDMFSPRFRAAHRLVPLREALCAIHWPPSDLALAQARRRLAFEELFLVSLGVALRHHAARYCTKARRIEVSEAVDRRIRRRLPFALSEAQNRAVADLTRDLASGHTMNRLLQGDVGVGKTAVAVYAMLAVVAAGGQAAVMVPTEVLAAQHFRYLKAMLRDSRVRLQLLTGATKGKEAAYAHLAAGEVDIVVGTHALFSEPVQFRDLALAVVDEQHKFGVLQRRLLRAKGRNPHVLVMTATPVPRTLTLTLYGDLDLSVIDQRPRGFKPIVTRRLSEKNRPEAYALVRRAAAKGQQTFVVLPRVEHDPQAEIRDAQSEYEKLRRQVFPQLQVALLHGQMSSAQKQRVARSFLSGALDVLVCTVIIEVGLDSPAASLMIVEHADRFGLATLHQLRGRLGRRGQGGLCLLGGEPESRRAQRNRQAAGLEPAAERARQRLEILCQTNDGFLIAERDFELRGPGEFFGTQQHGLPELRVADLLRDQHLLLQARQAAQQLVAEDPELRKPENLLLRDRVRRVFDDRLELVDVG